MIKRRIFSNVFFSSLLVTMSSAWAIDTQANEPQTAKVQNSSKSNTNEIRIAVVGALSGISKDLGIAAKNGVALAAAEINAQGGVAGKKIIMVQYDDKGTAEGAEKAVNEIIAKGNIDAVFGPTNSAAALKVTPMLQRAKIPTFITGADGSHVGILQQYMKDPVSYIFRTIPNDLAQTQALVAEAKRNGVQSIALFADNTAFGESGAALVNDLFTKAGIKVSSGERFALSTRDFESQMQRIRTQKVDAIVIWGLGLDAAAFRISMNRNGLRLPIYGPVTLSQQDYLGIAGANAAGTYVAVGYTLNDASIVAKRFYRNYRRFTGQAVFTNPTVAASGFDSMYLYALAVQQAGSTESAKVVDALENLQNVYDGVLQTYDSPFNKLNHEAASVVNVKIGTIKTGDTAFKFNGSVDSEADKPSVKKR